MNTALHPRTTRIGAFTLIELLIVLAVIGILASILIPAVGMVQKRSNAAKGISNLRQIGVALSMYVSENNGALPYARIPPVQWNAKYPDKPVVEPQPWTVQLTEYLPLEGNAPDIYEHKVFVCPNASYLDDSGSLYDEASLHRTYAGTDAFYGKDGDGNYSESVQRRLISVDSPADVLIAIDAKQAAARPECDAICQWQEAQSDFTGGGSTTTAHLDFRQPSDSVNALYLDGHVGPLRFDESTGLNEYKWNGRSEALAPPTS
ncbi:MAG: type II secretion system protein [Coraliomargarita sp.]